MGVEGSTGLHIIEVPLSRLKNSDVAALYGAYNIVHLFSK